LRLQPEDNQPNFFQQFHSKQIMDTSQKEIAALASEHSLLRILIDNLPDCIYAKDAKARKVIANPADLENLGCRTEAEAIGKTDFDLFPQDLAAGYFADDQSVLQTGQPVVNREEKVVLPNGETRWLLTTKVPWRDASGKIIGLVGIGRNVTHQRKAEIKMKEERNLLRTLIDNLPDGIYAKDTEARKIMANPADLKNLGCKTEAEAIGKTDFDFFPKEIAEAFFADDQSVLKEGKPVINREEKAVLPNGETRWLLTSKIPWRDASGKIIGLVGIGRDITDRKDLEEQMVNARRMESLGRLATGVAHDLNNILAPILISIELLQKKLQDEDYLKMLAKAEASAHRGADIIKQMLWFGRGMAGQRLQVDLQQLARGTAQLCSETFNKAICVETQIAPDLWTVVGDAAQLHQVLMNLCLNARDAMPSGGTLTVAARNTVVNDNRFVVLEVKDTGCGIAPGLLDKIYEPFFTTKEVGHGLGLSTAQSIVKSHGGFIRTESQPGHGATFRVHLPAQV
jgi:PAS domain S-box-containing protein